MVAVRLYVLHVLTPQQSILVRLCTNSCLVVLYLHIFEINKYIYLDILESIIRNLKEPRGCNV